MRLYFLFIIFLISGLLSAQQTEKWSSTIPNLGSFSSPRATDLNNDGIKDIVIGAGKQEFITSDSAIIALNGKNGSILWTAFGHDQIYGSANFMDITADGIDDIFINGRSGLMKCVNGKTGKDIWNFIEEQNSEIAREKGWFNFYNMQFIPDLDGDGYNDILASNGGDVMKEPFDPNRPVGYLVLISGKTGKLIQKAKMPDGKETYMSPVIFDLENKGGLDIIYGTGGETIGGSLYRTTLNDLRRGDLSKSIKLATSSRKGFIAPPVLVDITADGIKDIICLSVDGRLIAINGKTNKNIWVTGFENTEGYSVPAIANLNEDDVPDFFALVNTGVWPIQDYSVSMAVDGKSGKIFKSDTIGYYQITSPIAFDIDNNGIDEILVPSNLPKNDRDSGKIKFTTTLILFDFANRITERLAPLSSGSNGSSTPWVGDLDNDGNYDLVYLYQTDAFNDNIFSGFKINCINLNIKIQKQVKWGSYMGSYFNAVYDNK